MVKKILDVAASVATVVACVAVVYFVLSRQPMQSSASPPPTGYSPGDVISDFGGVQFAKAAQTLLVVFRSNCAYCIRGTEFYQRVVNERNSLGASTRIVAVAPSTDTDAQQFPANQGWQPDALELATPGSLKIAGVPTLLLVDSKGVVLHTWLGQLTQIEQDAVIALTGGRAAGGN